jgi:hypothetical protein
MDKVQKYNSFNSYPFDWLSLGMYTKFKELPFQQLNVTVALDLYSGGYGSQSRLRQALLRFHLFC